MRRLIGACLGMIVLSIASALPSKAAAEGCCKLGSLLCSTTSTQAGCAAQAKAAGTCFVFEEGRVCLPNGVCSEPDKLSAGAAAPAQCAPDLAPPTCALADMLPGPPAQIDVRIQDTGCGLGEVDLLVADNVSVSIPDFAAGSQDSVLVTALKCKDNLSSRLGLRVIDVAGNTTTCDPVLTRTTRVTGKPESQTLLHVPALEGSLTVENGSPGLRNLEIQVNGRMFRLAGLKDSESSTIDISSAMLPDDDNIIVLTGSGKPGGSAGVLIWDGRR
jgi:hypothetical protein